jgi:DNA-binding MarR family transcriptional regulator
MSCNGKAGPAPAGGWLEGDQRRAWLAYIRIQLRLAYEMNRQLLADSGMSLPDYDVLTALSVADGGRMPITVLAAHIGWERSRLSHHARRMSARGLVTCGPSAADRRVTEVGLTGRGRQALEEAAPGHVDLVRRLFFEGLPDGLVRPLSEANHRDPVMTSHMNDRKPGSVTIDIGSLGMTKRDRDLAKRESGAVTAGSGQVTGLARPLIIAVVAVWGLGYGAVPVAAQSWMARAMPASVEGGLALFVSALQGSLAAGSAAGGIVYDAEGPGGVLVVAAVFAALGGADPAGPGRSGHQRRAGARRHDGPRRPHDRTTVLRPGRPSRRRPARSSQQHTVRDDDADVTVRGHTEAAARKGRNCYA